MRDFIMNNSPQIAIIGAGAWGMNHVRVWNKLKQLKIVCDLDSQRLDLIRMQYPDITCTTNIDEVFDMDEVRGVVVATPAHSHVELALHCLERGKDVFVEKPMALNYPDAEKLVRAAKKLNKILMVGHVLEYHPAVIKLRELIQTGELGRILYIYSHRLNIGKIRVVENAMWSFAPHDVAIILRILETMPESVTCQGEGYLNNHVADITLMSFKFPNKVQGHIYVSWLHPFKEHRFIVVGEKQMAVFDDTLPWENKLVLYPHQVQWVKGQIPVAHKADAHPVPLQPVEPLLRECEHFLQCIQTRSKPLTDGESGSQVVKVLDAAQQSLVKGSIPVPMDAIGSEPLTWWHHPTAIIDPGARIGAGTRVWHFSHVMKNAVIGEHCILGQNVFVGQGVRIGNRVKIQNNVSIYTEVTLEDEVFCGPSMVFTNVINPRSAIERKHEFRPTLVKKGATLGANCTLICGVTIGRYAMVGAGAVVTRDVPDYALVTGVPARLSGWVCSCGVRLHQDELTLTCPACGKAYRRVSANEIQPIDSHSS